MSCTCNTTCPAERVLAKRIAMIIPDGWSNVMFAIVYLKSCTKDNAKVWVDLLIL